MAQIFPAGATTAFRLVLLAFVLMLIGLFLLGQAPRVSFWSEANVNRQQRIQFSHKHHVGDDGIDCRYCHTSVESSAFAGIPATQICMNCHSQIWLNSPMLAPVHESYKSGTPLRWIRVYDLPDYVYFDHSIHIHKGVGCSTCHGRIDQMPLTRAVTPLIMEWCLNCHRHPEEYVRPIEEIYNMEWRPPNDQQVVGRKLVQAYQIKDTKTLTSCSICHR